MDGENNGKPYFLMDDLRVSLFFGNTHLEKKQSQLGPATTLQFGFKDYREKNPEN